MLDPNPQTPRPAITPKQHRALEGLAASQEAHPDVRLRASQMLLVMLGEAPPASSTERAWMASLKAGADPYMLLRGHHVTWKPVPAISLTKQERATLEAMVTSGKRCSDPELLRAADHAALILSLSERPSSGTAPDRKMLRVVGAVGATEAARPEIYAEHLRPKKEGASGWRPDQEMCGLAKSPEVEALAVRPKQKSRLVAIRHICAHPERSSGDYARELDLPVGTVNSLLWLLKTKGVRDCVVSSTAVGQIGNQKPKG